MDNNRYLTIDGIPVEINGEKNLLALIQKVGIKMPTFCYHSELSTYGACRMCMVEDQWGTLHASCSTPPKPGMEIRTNTERLRKYRKVILELLLANHCRDCTTCDNNEKCKLQDIARRFHIEGVRFPNAASKPDVDDSSPCITIDHHKCILCGDCVRTCNEIQNVGVIDFMNRGSRMVVGTAFHKPIGETDCVGCGQCSAVCPTGAIVVKNNISEVWKALSDKDTMVTIQIAPAVRVAIGRELGLQDGQNTMGLIVAALRRMGLTRSTTPPPPQISPLWRSPPSFWSMSLPETNSRCSAPAALPGYATLKPGTPSLWNTFQAANRPCRCSRRLSASSSGKNRRSTSILR